jgi:hypothetical protein
VAFRKNRRRCDNASLRRRQLLDYIKNSNHMVKTPKKVRPAKRVKPSRVRAHAPKKSGKSLFSLLLLGAAALAAIAAPKGGTEIYALK